MGKINFLINYTFIGYVLLYLVWLPGVGYRFCSYAEEVTQSQTIEVNGDQVEYLPKEKKVVGRGNVSIDYKGVRLTCDKIEVYTDTKDVEAEGNVILKGPTVEIYGHKVRYNFETKKGEILEAKARSGDWYAKGEKTELMEDGSMNIYNGYITSCDRDTPHYKITTRKVIVHPDGKVIAKDVLFKVGNMPVAYLPRYNYSIKTDWPTLNITPGKKKKWGVFALSTYRYEVDESNKFTLRLDERQYWGLGEGFDYRYSFKNYGAGIFKTYYTYQRDRDRHELLRGEEERYRVQLRHRIDMTERTSAILEFHKLSDSEFTKDYFYREEYNKDPSPESYFYFLDKESEYALSFLARKRVNRFQSVVERLPEIHFDLKDQRILGSPLYFKTDTTFTNLTSKTSNSSTDSDVVRFDIYNKLSSPLRLLDFLSISPFVGMRDTFYSKDINGDENEFRSAFYTGIDLSTKFTRVYDASGSFLGVEFNRLKHIITPSIQYQYIHEPSTTPGNLQQFDDIDNINRKSIFTFGLENSLKTKRLEKGAWNTFDLGYFLVTADYLYKPENGSRFSNVKGDLEITPYNWLRIESDTQYDPDTRDFQTWNADLFIDKGDDWRFGLGSRYWQNEEHELTSQLSYRLNAAWAIRLFGRYDLKEVQSDGHKIINRFSGKEITLIKDLHCWIGELSLDIDRDGGTTVWFVLKLKASPKVPFDFKDYYAYPKERRQ